MGREAKPLINANIVVDWIDEGLSLKEIRTKLFNHFNVEEK